jgi:hypothetical protein
MTITQPETPKWACTLLNHLYELEKKVTSIGDTANALRNIAKMKDAFEEMGLFYEDPMGQVFKETRTDLEATISGTGTEELYVVEVIKPIIRRGDRQFSRIAQKGIVIVESKPIQK